MHLKHARLPIPPRPPINFLDPTSSNTYLKLMWLQRGAEARIQFGIAPCPRLWRRWPTQALVRRFASKGF